MSEVNQCDGCMSGLPLDEKGFHRYSGGAVSQACERSKYEDWKARAEKAEAELAQAHAQCNEAARVNAELLSESEAARDKALAELAQARKERDKAIVLLKDAAVQLGQARNRRDALEEELAETRIERDEAKAAMETDLAQAGARANTLKDAMDQVRNALNVGHGALAKAFAEAALAGEKDSGREQPGQRPGPAAPCANSVAPAVPATGRYDPAWPLPWSRCEKSNCCLPVGHPGYCVPTLPIPSGHPLAPVTPASMRKP